MVIEQLGAWSSVERGIQIMAADGRIEGVVLSCQDTLEQVEKAKLISPEALEQLRRAIIIGGYTSFELSDGGMVESEGEEGRIVHALRIFAS